MSGWSSEDDRPIEDWESPDPGDDDESFTATIDCPACGAEIYEDAPACPACGNYVTRQRTIWDGRPAWWIILGLAGMIALIYILLPF